MTQFLPPNLLALFAPRDPIFFLPPTTKLSHEKKTHGYFGVGQYLHLFEDPKDTPPPIKIETREERLERKQREKLERAAYIREQGIALWDPFNNASSTEDAYKTLFVARINPDTSESRLKKEFEIYGPIRKLSLVHDKISGKPKGYAFIEFENEKDMHAAYKHADGKKIEGRRVLVDVERGRTVKGWLPRRLGGGINNSKTRNSREDREDSYRSERRDRDRSSRRSRSAERERSRRRSRDRERERSRDYRDKSHRDSHRDRHKDRYDSKLRRDESKYDSRGGYDRDGDQVKVSHNYDGDSYVSSRRHRSRSRDRERKRHARSRSRSQDRKRSRMIESNNGSMNMDKERHYNYDLDTGEIEEGEDRSYDVYSKHSNNDYDNYNSYSQPAYVAYKVKSDN